MLINLAIIYVNMVDVWGLLFFIVISIFGNRVNYQLRLEKVQFSPIEVRKVGNNFQRIRTKTWAGDFLGDLEEFSPSLLVISLLSFKLLSSLSYKALA
jgi:hypothetical protein